MQNPYLVLYKLGSREETQIGGWREVRSFGEPVVRREQGLIRI